MQQKARAEVQVLASFNKTDNFQDELLEEEDLSDRGRTRSRKVFSNSTINPNRSQCPSLAVETQAIDRVHRMGQLRNDSVTHFIVKDSIEGRILQVQERKMNRDGCEEGRKKGRIEQLKLLFE